MGYYCGKGCLDADGNKVPLKGHKGKCPFKRQNGEAHPQRKRMKVATDVDLSPASANMVLPIRAPLASSAVSHTRTFANDIPDEANFDLDLLSDLTIPEHSLAHTVGIAGYADYIFDPFIDLGFHLPPTTTLTPSPNSNFAHSATSDSAMPDAIDLAMSDSIVSTGVDDLPIAAAPMVDDNNMALDDVTLVDDIVQGSDLLRGSSASEISTLGISSTGHVILEPNAPYNETSDILMDELFANSVTQYLESNASISPQLLQTASTLPVPSADVVSFHGNMDHMHTLVTACAATVVTALSVSEHGDTLSNQIGDGHSDSDNAGDRDREDNEEDEDAWQDEEDSDEENGAGYREGSVVANESRLTSEGVSDEEIIYDHKLPDKKTKLPKYIVHIGTRSRTHSARRQVCTRKLRQLDSATAPYIFQYIARPESILARNGRTHVYFSPLMAAVLEQGNCDFLDILHQLTKKHERGRRSTEKDVIALNCQVHAANEARRKAEAKAAQNAEQVRELEMRLARLERSATA